MSSQSATRIASYFAVFAAGSIAAAAFFSATQSGAANSATQPIWPAAQQPTQDVTLQPLATNEATEAPSVELQNEQPVEMAPRANAEPQIGSLRQAAPTEATSNNEAATGVASQVAIADIRRGTMVSVSGVVERVSDEDEFVIRDASGAIPVWTGQSFFTVQPGESVVVNGFVDDDLLLEIYAQEIIKQDGSVITISGERW